MVAIVKQLYGLAIFSDTTSIVKRTFLYNTMIATRNTQTNTALKNTKSRKGQTRWWIY